MNQASQFIGYWSRNHQPELAATWNKLLNARSLQPYIQSENHGIWGLGFTDKNTIVQELVNRQEVIVNFSASGLTDVPEAWVKIAVESLILGREPFGRSPLYWTEEKGIIWFASRWQLLLSIVPDWQISFPAVYAYSCFSYIPTPLTPGEDIFAVPAGTEISWQEKALLPTSQQWYQWQEAPELIRAEKDAIFNLQILLKNAIQKQIGDLSCQPVGVFLSGGIDSSVVAALLVQAGIKVKAYALDFTAVLKNQQLSELPYAQQVADFLQIPLTIVAVTPAKIRRAIALTAEALDLPFGDGATIPLFLLSQVASQEVEVIFNGEHGDQLFAGWTNKPLIAASIYHGNSPPSDFYQDYLKTFHALYGYEAQIYQPRVYQQIQNLDPQDWLQTALDPTFSTHLLSRLRRASLMLKGAQNIQPRANNIALSQGLSVRSPFCDLPLAEWTFQLAGELCLQGVCEKYILKRAVEYWLPSTVVWREKQGMAIPVTSLCLNSLHDQIKFWLNPRKLNQQGIWQPKIAEQVINGNFGGQIRGGRVGRILWLLMMWQAWQSTVLEKNRQPDLIDFFWDLFHR